MLIVRRRALARVYDQQVEGLDLEEDVCVVVFMCILSFVGVEQGVWRELGWAQVLRLLDLMTCHI